MNLRGLKNFQIVFPSSLAKYATDFEHPLFNSHSISFRVDPDQVQVFYDDS